jgi:sulfatase modifying factor 1
MKLRDLATAILPILAALVCNVSASASTAKPPSLVVTAGNGFASVIVDWRGSIAWPVDVEHSSNMVDWVKISVKNWQQVFYHNTFTSGFGFYRLRWNPASTNSTAMVTVEGGNLRAGTLATNSTSASVPVATFQIGKYEVTWDEWKELRTWALTNGYPDIAVGGGSGGNHPVRNVSWYDVAKWCNAKSEKEGLVPAYWFGGQPFRNGVPREIPSENIFAVDRLWSRSPAINGYRLPTAYEWEWAARGGTNNSGFRHSGSNDPHAVAWHGSNSVGAVVDLEQGRGTWPVGTKAPNRLGIHDMSGNVSECFDDSLYGGYRHFRGGSWWSNFDGMSFSVLGSWYVDADPACSHSHIGFRLARPAAPAPAPTPTR